MSTRGTLGVIHNEREIAAYNHSDSYPDWLGVKTLAFLREADLEDLRQRAEKVTIVSDETPPTPKQIEQLHRYANMHVGGPVSGTPEENASWYQLLRETQGDLDAMLAAGYIEDGSDFPLDSLFCEWAYIVNLDDEVLEVYKGFQAEPHDKGRYAKRAPEGEPSASGRTYYPVALVATFPLNDLPSDEQFLSHPGLKEEDE